MGNGLFSTNDATGIDFALTTEALNIKQDVT
jgi:hypothetical protein